MHLLLESKNHGKTQDPVIKWVYEAVNAWPAENGSGAYANGTDVYWVAYIALGGDFTFSVFTHETAHNQDGYYFYEGNGRRWGTGAEDHADSNISQDIGDGSLVINLRRDISLTADDSNNLKLSTVIGKENLNRYYREMFETFYVLDYLTGQAFLQLTPEEQSKLAVQVSYNNTNDQEAGSNTTVYSKISAEAFEDMQLENMKDLWDNKIALRNAGTIGINKYGGDTHYTIYWYQPHNDNGVCDSHSFKRLSFEMLGYGGYDGYVTFASARGKTDLDALRKISGNDTITWKEYKMSRYDNVKNNLSNISYFDPNEVIELYKEALKLDANNGNRNNTNNLRKLLYGIVKRATQDFTKGGIYSSNDIVEISTAEQFVEVLNSAEWGDYIITNDLDFSTISVDTESLVTNTFIGRIDGNGHKFTGLTKTLFDNAVYAEIQNLIIENPEYSENTRAIVAISSKHILFDDVVVNNTNINLPFVGTNNGQNKWLGTTSINVKNNEISSLDELLQIATNNITRKSNYVLTTDLDLSSITPEVAIIPGTFFGVIDGAGHTLSNLNKSLFQNLNGTIKNINIENVNIGSVNENNVAVIAKVTSGAIIEDIKMSNINVVGREHVSAVVALSNNSKYNRISINNMNLTGKRYYAGGIVGRSYDSIIQDVYISGTMLVKETHNGGIIGGSNRDYMNRIYCDIDVTKEAGTDSRNKNAGLYGAIETGPITVKDVLVIGNMSNDLFKVTPAVTDAEKNDINKYLKNVYELENSTGKSNSEISSSIKKVTENDLKNINFYRDIMKWSEEIWDFSNLETGNGPSLK